PGDDAVSIDDFRAQYGGGNSDIGNLNQELLTLAVNSTSPDGIYRVGAGDEISVRVFGVEELSGNYRIDGHGRVSLPLIGSVEVSGYTLAETEKILTNLYGDQYLRNPEITVSVLSFRSQQFTTVGAISRPLVYNTERQVTLIEALAMAGGLSSNAGQNVFLTDRIRDPETGQMQTRNLIIDIEELMSSANRYNVVLGEAAVINVPAAGSIFVEGAVHKPGVYQSRGQTTVLKAITMAGGLRFEANRSDLRVLRRDPLTDQWHQQSVAMRDIRETPLVDLVLNDGDIVMVESGPIRSVWVGTWEVVSRLVFLGLRPIQ
ncbi:MAG: polysaccharide biosynthesis/export family protein, partial [Xanthomonadaceae bacterium]|nr:polysaccharide biosynthesis/export family protein [Xanthomonadaceae bacterium]